TRVLRGEQMALKGGGIPTGRHAPRVRPSSAELEKQAGVVRRALAKKELGRLRREAAEHRRKVREMFEDADAQVKLHDEQREAEIADARRTREEAEEQASAFVAQSLKAAAEKRRQEAELAEEVRQQAEADRLRKKREREARFTNDRPLER
ncbi:unnamed protein product, partial [Symbiodinium pilosum]